MIRILPASDEIKRQNNITNDAYTVFDGDAFCGFCEYKQNSPDVEIIKIKCDDMALCDGLVRQVLSFSLDNDCENAVFGEETAKILSSLKIIKNNDVQNLNILEFFTKLNCC